jgi:hypothetical protein
MGLSASREAIKAIRDWAVHRGPQLGAPPDAHTRDVGSLVFPNDEEQRARLPKSVSPVPPPNDHEGRASDSPRGRCGRRGDEGLGGGARRRPTTRNGSSR